MIVHRKDDSDEDSDEELPPLHERLQWNKDSDDEENSEEIEKNRMSYNAKFRKNENKRHERNNQHNNNDKKRLFSGTTKLSPTIIIHSKNEMCNNPMTNNNENNTPKIKNKINNVKFGDDIRQDHKSVQRENDDKTIMLVHINET